MTAERNARRSCTSRNIASPMIAGHIPGPISSPRNTRIPATCRDLSSRTIVCMVHPLPCAVGMPRWLRLCVIANGVMPFRKLSKIHRTISASAGTISIPVWVYPYRRAPVCGFPSRARSTIASFSRRDVSSDDRQACATSPRR